MHPREALDRWADVRHGLCEALGRLTDEQLRLSPREGLWPLGTVARHIAEAERHWLEACTVEGPVRFSRTEFTADRYPTVAAVRDLLAEVHAETEASLAAADAATMDRQVTLPWGERLTVGDPVWHVLQHEIHHRGEIYLMLGLLGMDAPDV